MAIKKRTMKVPRQHVLGIQQTKHIFEAQLVVKSFVWLDKQNSIT